MPEFSPPRSVCASPLFPSLGPLALRRPPPPPLSARPQCLPPVSTSPGCRLPVLRSPDLREVGLRQPRHRVRSPELRYAVLRITNCGWISFHLQSLVAVVRRELGMAREPVSLPRGRSLVWAHKGCEIMLQFFFSILSPSVCLSVCLSVRS